MTFLKFFGRYSMFFLVHLVNLVDEMLAKSGRAYKILLIPGFERLRWRLGVWRAWRTFYRTYARVPAYRKFLDQRGGIPELQLNGNNLPDLTHIPETDKDSYIKPFAIAEKCLDGQIPSKGVMVDESSGSSGKPTSWVRGPTERHITSQMIRLSYEESVTDKRQVIILNAFALGAWATGMNVSISLTPAAILKSTGPNLDKIVSTMLEFGPSFRYVLMGYPPFLKSVADDPRIDWIKFDADICYGGEGVSESLRDYLLKHFKKVVGSYGASDLEINMAFETEAAISLRRLILSDDAARKAIIRADYGVTPMIFQYNPLAYYIETNDKGELVVTIARPTNLSPRVRYNIHDRGHVLRLPELREKLAAAGHDKQFNSVKGLLDLHFLLVYGRSDMSISYYGAKITPDSVREVLYGIDELAPTLSTFRLISFETEKHDQRTEIAIEMIEGADVPKQAGSIAKLAIERLAKINGDFYNAYFKTATADNLAEVNFYAWCTGPFTGGQKRLKNEYVASNLKYDKL
jgi:phenylacetate-CoA ligase